MKTFWRLLLIFAILLYIGCTAVFTIFHQQFKDLSVKDNVQPSKCILVYNPKNDQEILVAAKRIMKENPGSKLIYTPFVMNNEIDSLQLLKKVDIKKKNVIPEYYSTSMKESAMNVSTLMHKEDMTDCILVGRDYEMNRLLETFEKNNPLFNFYHKKVEIDGKSYLETSEGRKQAEKELWQYPKLWLNR